MFESIADATRVVQIRLRGPWYFSESCNAFKCVVTCLKSCVVIAKWWWYEQKHWGEPNFKMFFFAYLGNIKGFGRSRSLLCHL